MRQRVPLRTIAAISLIGVAMLSADAVSWEAEERPLRRLWSAYWCRPLRRRRPDSRRQSRR